MVPESEVPTRPGQPVLTEAQQDAAPPRSVNGRALLLLAHGGNVVTCRPATAADVDPPE
jgi:hypothetical protein